MATIRRFRVAGARQVNVEGVVYRAGDQFEVALAPAGSRERHIIAQRVLGQPEFALPADLARAVANGWVVEEPEPTKKRK